MRKKLFALTLVLAMGMSMVACGDKEAAKNDVTSTSDSVDTEYRASDFVTLGEYKNLEITLDGEYEVTDENFLEYLNSQVESAGTYLKDDSKTVVEADSFVNVNYTGIQNGEAFQGGTAQDVTLDIANNGDVSGTSYIDGFTAGLVGHSVGETIDCDVTFPENYGSESLAGQTVIFRFEINYIATKADVESMSDEEKAGILGYDDVDTMNSTLKANLATTLKSNYEYDLRLAVMNKVMDNAKIESYPATVDVRVDKALVTYEAQYEAYGMKLDEVLEQQGMTRDDFKAQVKEQVVTNMEQELVFEAVALDLGLEVTAEEFEANVTSLMSSYGYQSQEALFEAYAVTDGDGASYLKRIMLCNKAIDECVSSAVVK